MFFKSLFIAIWFIFSISPSFATGYDANIILNKVEVSFWVSSKKKIQKISDTNTIIKKDKNKSNIRYSLEAIEEEENTKAWISQSKLHFLTTAGTYLKGVVTITNQGEKNLENSIISLNLPKGVIIEKSLCKINGTLSCDISKNLEAYHITLPTIKKRKSVTLEYYFSVSIAKKRDLFGSLVLLHKNKNISNLLKLQIKLKKDHIINSKDGFIIGKVNSLLNESVEGIVIYLSNGYSSTTDKSGKFHFEGVKAGSFVVQVDTDTITDGYEPYVCSQNSRQAGSSISTFVDLKPAMVKRVDFCLKKSSKKRENEKSKTVFTPKIEKREKMPRYSSRDISKYKDKKYKWLWPKKDGFVPSIGSIKSAILYPKDLKLKLFLNGEEIDALNSDGILKNSNEDSVIALFRGIDIQEGNNYLKAEFIDRDANIKHTMTRLVHFSGSPAKVKLIKEKSFLIADGTNSPVIALAMFDRYGYRVRESVKGVFYIDPPYQVLRDKDEKLKDSSSYTVSADGITYIKLQPTTLASNVKINIPTDKEELQVLVKLEPKMRDWVLVGFGEGSVGYRKISNEMKKTDEKEVYYKGKTAFFAKGTVLGDTLLTMAYDSGKVPDLELFDRIDPDEYYTIYGDGSFQNSEASSQKKLYIKMEKKEYSLLFGDMYSGLDKVELARYDRAMNGVKAVFANKNIDATLFASESKNIFVKDEIKPDATSGKYYLKNRNIVENSEKIYLVVRDFYRKEIIIEKKLLTPLLDYSIYYDEGSLYFREPVFGLSKDGNPRFIEVFYEISGDGEKEFIYGTHVSFKSEDEKYKAGVSYIKELKKSLQGVDFNTKFGSHIDVALEYASSKEDDKKSAYSYFASTAYRDSKKEILTYMRKQERDFGLGGQSSFASNAQRFGLDAHIKYIENFTLNLSAYNDTRLSDKSKTDVFELKNSYRAKKYNAYLGYKYYDDEFSSGSQILGGISKQFLNNSLKMQLLGEFSLKNDNEHFPTKTAIDATYTLTPKTDLFFRDEWINYEDDSTNIFSGGVRVKPWSEGMIKASVLSSGNNDQKSIYSNYLLNQGYKVNKNLMLSAAVERNTKVSGAKKVEDEYTSYTASTTYKKSNWSASLKTAYKDANESKINLDFGIYSEKKDLDLGLAFGIRTQQVGNSYLDISSNLSLAYRPERGVVIFNRADYKEEKSDTKRVKKYSNRFILSFKVRKNLELSTQYALKFTQNYLDDKKYNTLIDTLGLDVIYDISSKHDIGFNTKLMHDWRQKLYQVEYGAYTGYRVFKNSWLSIGYNFSRFNDDIFIDNIEGVYLKFRMKFDQSSLKEIAQSY